MIDILKKLEKAKSNCNANLSEAMHKIEPMIREYNWYLQQMNDNEAVGICYKEGERSGDGTIDEIEVDGDVVMAHWYCSWAYGGHDDAWLEMPVSILEDENWREGMEKKLKSYNRKEKSKEKNRDFIEWKRLSKKWGFKGAKK